VSKVGHKISLQATTFRLQAEEKNILGENKCLKSNIAQD
jgi:hypothetical protein